MLFDCQNLSWCGVVSEQVEQSSYIRNLIRNLLDSKAQPRDRAPQRQRASHDRDAAKRHSQAGPDRVEAHVWTIV
jgi:Arc/MetJ-type ribon-helix-helix transcriptional regulator